MILHPVKVIAFDCDGVLFDSTAANRAYYDHILEHFSQPSMTAAQQAYVHMHTVNESLAFLFPDPDQALAAEAYRRQMQPLAFIRLMTVDRHLHDLLNRLQGRVHTAVATNRVDTMDRVLAEHHLEGRFDLVVTAADVMRAKPHPDMLFKVMAHFSVEPEEMIYIGDSSIDQIAAHQAGVPFIAYANRDLDAVAHVEHLGQVMALIDGHRPDWR